jgi:hypothetical protein
MTAPFFAAWSAASFSGICVWPGTQQSRTEPPSVFINLSHASQVEARALKAPETTGVERLAIACGKALTGPVDFITIFYLELAQIVITHPYWQNQGPKGSATANISGVCILSQPHGQ